jgi:hypothetical protein
MQIDPQISAKILNYRNDYESFAQSNIKIKDHNTAKIVPLNFNNGQRILHIISEKMKAERGFVRIELLKSRRFGGSTYIEGRFYWRTSLNQNRNTFIVGHEERSTKTLYAMATLMQEQNEIAPATRLSNAQELIFDNRQGTGLKSQYELATARNLSAGRSQGIHYLHASELAFWPNPDILLDGLYQCVPDPPAEVEVYLESTAQGCGNRFHRDVMATYREGAYPYYIENGITYAWYNPDSDWVLVFIPWFVHERYTREFEDIVHREALIERVNAKVFDPDDLKWVDSEAKRLKDRYDLTYEQLYWREWAIENKCRGSIDVFHQEYPANVEEAFLSAGTNVFPKILCDDLDKLTKDPIVIGDVIERMGKPKIKPNPHGHFSLWEKPIPDETYFMTIDSAGGIKDLESTEREPDPSCIDVYCNRTGHQVAQWHGHIDYDLIADLAELIGNMFNKATACVELMNHGYTVVSDLKKKHYPMYKAQGDNPGWLTTKKTKPQMADGLYCMTRDGDIKIMCKETVSEMRTFVEESGKYNAVSGCHDERVDCGGMASQMMRLLPRKVKQTRRQEIGIQNWLNKDRQEDIGGYMEIRT